MFPVLPRRSSLLVYLLALSPACGALSNLTIDDTNTTFFTWMDDPAANPPSWAAITPATPCLYCSAQPQTRLIHNRTWHDGRSGSAGSFTFQGSAVYIYGIDLAQPANISFTMGNSTTYHYYTGSEQFVFDALFFSARNLTDNVNHTIMWVLRESSSNGTTALFDYAVVTIDQNNPTPSPSPTPVQSPASKSKSNTTIIVASTVSSIAGLLLAAGLLFLIRRRNHNAWAIVSTPFPLPRVHPTQEVPHSVADTYSGHPTTDQEFKPHASPLPLTSYPPDLSDSQFLTTGTGNSVVSQSLPDTDTERAPTEVASPVSTTSTRASFLEARLAILEAHVKQHLPPPYQQRNLNSVDDSNT
ncbi:hypothetical protein FB451DRAFT_1369674 [Mycena latifolia]|nr:hypothetical protein FB451DRAFT_1369674 [Mycena latifolia]